MIDIITAWHTQIAAELSEAREALVEATATAQLAQEQNAAALATVEAVKAALGRLQGLGAALAFPIAGRVAAAGVEVDTTAMAAKRTLVDRREASDRVARLELALSQLDAVLAAAAEPVAEAA